MKRINFNKIMQIALGLMLIVMFSCSSSNKQNIQVEIPAELQSSPEAVAYIKAMTKTTNKATKLFNDIVKITGGKDIDNSDELTTMQTLKMAKAAGQLMMVSSKMEEYKIQKLSIDSLLSPVQIAALDKVCLELEEHMGKIDPKNITIDESEMQAQQEMQEKQQAETDSLTALHEEAISQQKAEGFEGDYSEPEEPENSEFIWWHILFPIGILAFMVYMVIGAYKKIKSGVKNIGYSFGDIKDKVHEAKEMTDKKGPDGKEMSDEEKKGLDALDNLLNK